LLKAFIEAFAEVK